ncbi:MAG TPA: hypothetical protein VEH30_11140 [Terriglobales bacterium]|nr:hypothetical protein [Terriglobales bacterium]
MRVRPASMKRVLLRSLVAVVVLLGLVYAGDYLSLRFRIPHNRPQFGTVSVTEMYAIHEKNNKTEYEFPPPQDETCVQSLFPHFGYSPCWYLRRHTQQRIDI